MRPARPAVSVVVPFAGNAAAARRALGHLRALRLDPGDETIVADNTVDGVAAASIGGLVRVVGAAGERSSYHARNAGAAASRRDWILFCDADCAPESDLVARYFEPPPPERAGALGGAIVDHPEHDSLLARYAASRNFYRGERGLQGSDGGYAPTGNLLLRRAAFEGIGGFAEGIRSAGDVDLCWRLQAAGWTLERRPGAVVAHRHRDDLAPFVAMLARYGAGSAWLDRRYPGSSPRWRLSAAELVRAAADAL
ncbi:MAG: glycosyltransferase, partial [Solirubrobacterales bacterium]|nr:glycosyltransferase [Solirubrobacterales bacterium]